MENTDESKYPQPQQSTPATAAGKPSSPLSDPTVTPFLQQSPTLQAGLAQLNRDNVGVVWGAAGAGTYLVPRTQVVIDENAIGQGARIARSLSHEIGHHRFTEQPDQSSKHAYVTNMLRG
ncbi:hypothetical protein [Xanthomonas hortorum]|uniref:hypothetical protein n=1 Tax=Xanthomonas hortorum TaxID=56454 RepID=UPI002935C1EF|nr:hypothetical protein [Xanthomonas hortorum]MDV2450038.1 hypothetical protein [Xanthomonas hortorum NBC5720]